MPPIPEGIPQGEQDFPVREGLPAHYRMRADAHYVDQLDVPPASSVQILALDVIDTTGEATPPAAALLESITRYGVLEPLLVQKRDRRYKLIAGRHRLAAAAAAGLREVPCLVRRLTEDEARSLAATVQGPPDTAAPTEPPNDVLDEGQVAASLSAVLSCAGLVNEGAPHLTREVALDMIRAETQRALCAIRTAQFITRGFPQTFSPVTVRRVLTSIVNAVGPEVRLRGSRLVTRVEVADETMIDVDGDSLVAAVSAVVLLLSAGLRDVRGARLDLQAAASHPGRLTLTIAQESVILPNATLAITNGEEPVFESSVAPLVAIRHLARHYGGTCAASRLARGTQVSITLPQSE